MVSWILGGCGSCCGWLWLWKVEKRKRLRKGVYVLLTGSEAVVKDGAIDAQSHSACDCDGNVQSGYSLSEDNQNSPACDRHVSSIHFTRVRREESKR